MSALQGFVLQPTYRLEGPRPVVHLYGRLEDGRSFLVRDDRQRPHFFVAEHEEHRVRSLAGADVHACDRRTFAGEPVLRVEVRRPADAPPLRRQLESRGVVCYEADVRFAMRFLIDHGIRGSIEVVGEPQPGERWGVDVAFHNPEVGAGKSVPALSVLSFDLETDPEAQRIYSVGLYGCGAAEVLLVAGPKKCRAKIARVVGDEKELLERFAERVRELDPDILTGWSIHDFDVPVLMRRASALGVQLLLGRGPGPLRQRQGRGSSRYVETTVAGRVVLDGVHVLRGAFVRMESQALDAVAREVLGEGKTLSGADRAQTITDWFFEDPDRLVEYNLQDARLVVDILERLSLVELSVARSRLTGMPLDRVSSSIAAFDFLYLSALGRRGLVAPSVEHVESFEPMGGGAVLKPQPGLYRNVAVLDFKSLYPSLIRTFGIDPLGYHPGDHHDAAPEKDFVAAPNGATFRRQIGILPGLLDELFPEREQAKAGGDGVRSQAIKILMNSFYGVLGATSCRFFNPEISNAITGWGRWLLHWCRDVIEARGLEVLYGDTDSLFVATGAEDAEQARRIAMELVDSVGDAVTQVVAERWQVESRLELELEKIFLQLFLPPLRGREGEGAMKRYVGLVEGAAGREVVFTGLEAVRTDWTDFARQAQRELFALLFEEQPEQPVSTRVAELAVQLRSGTVDDLLVYRKALRKDPDAYTATTPPHVAAARKMARAPGRRVAYVMTLAGPEPAEERRSPIDYEHYVQKQLKPIAEPILQYQGLTFDRVIGDDRQLLLFE